MSAFRGSVPGAGTEALPSIPGGAAFDESPAGLEVPSEPFSRRTLRKERHDTIRESAGEKRPDVPGCRLRRTKTERLDERDR